MLVTNSTTCSQLANRLLGLLLLVVWFGVCAGGRVVAAARSSQSAATIETAPSPGCADSVVAAVPHATGWLACNLAQESEPDESLGVEVHGGAMLALVGYRAAARVPVGGMPKYKDPSFSRPRAPPARGWTRSV